MGLKNQALHVMLANPHLSPFSVVERPTLRHDWMLVDHLIMRFKVKASDYVERDPRASVLNMARTLAEHYNQERCAAECLILVKDGSGAQKPAVRDNRDRYPLAPHLDFCRRNADAIDYATLKLLCDMGMKNQVFLVTGCEWGRGGPCESNSGDVVFHLHVATDHIGTVARPPGVQRVFVTTFANPSHGHLEFLKAACQKSASTEADTLMVELANILPGTVTVCTADSDVIAVFTACGREGLTLRLANMSYKGDRPMHGSTFANLLMGSPDTSLLRPKDSDLEGRESRFRTLYDISPDDDHLGEQLEILHGEWESLVLDESQDPALPQQLARYFYLGGIRGSVYGEFLTRLFELNPDGKADVACRIITTILVGPQGWKSKCAFLDIFKLLPECHDTDDSEAADENRKTCCGEVAVEGNGRTVDTKRSHANLNKLSKLYMEAVVPRFSNGRYLRLNKMGPHLYIRIKQDVAKCDRLKHKLLVFMILFGTDYTRTFNGLGPKGLLKAGLNPQFSKWCEDLKAAWHDEDPERTLKRYHVLYKKLAGMARIPEKTQTRWTQHNSALAFRTMKYVYDLWRLKHPKASRAYGFCVDENNVMTYIE